MTKCKTCGDSGWILEQLDVADFRERPCPDCNEDATMSIEAKMDDDS